MRRRENFQELVSRETMQNFLRLDTSQRLKWLDEARAFFFAAVPEKTKRIAEKMRKKGW